MDPLEVAAEELGNPATHLTQLQMRHKARVAHEHGNSVLFRCARPEFPSIILRQVVAGRQFVPRWTVVLKEALLDEKAHDVAADLPGSLVDQFCRAFGWVGEPTVRH